MQAHIFENVNDLNRFLAQKKSKKVQVFFNSTVVGKLMDKDGKPTERYEVIDRFMVIEL